MKVLASEVEDQVRDKNWHDVAELDLIEIICCQIIFSLLFNLLLSNTCQNVFFRLKFRVQSDSLNFRLIELWVFIIMTISLAEDRFFGGRPLQAGTVNNILCPIFLSSTLRTRVLIIGVGGTHTCISCLSLNSTFFNSDSCDAVFPFCRAILLTKLL
jgi:hypothetical protein